MQDDIFFKSNKFREMLKKHLNITKSKMAAVSDKGIFCNKIDFKKNQSMSTFTIVLIQFTRVHHGLVDGSNASR